MRLTATILLLIASPIFIYSQGQKPKSGPIPSWVTQNLVNLDNNKLDKEAEDGYVDLAFEKQVSLAENVTFYKKSIKILNEAGIQNSSDVSVNFDPTYEELTFHSIYIIRNKQKIQRLNLNKIKTIQQEKDLDRFTYDGTKTSVVFLEDVRKGDIVEYSYSIKGSNPIFGGKYSDMLETQFSVPVYHLYYKLLVPLNRELIIKNNLHDLSPVITNNTKEKSYEWKASDLGALNVPTNTPSWYDPYPTIMISEYKSWKEVNDWAIGLFSFDIPISNQLQKKIKELKLNKKTPKEVVLASLRFVQDEIRYLGIEIGENSHRPNLPDKTLSQRFGDCKDKSYLFCTLLRGMNIDADPVLINTGYKKTIGDWLPSPTHFDHTVVRVMLGNSVYWFDPTLSYQRGTLENISFPDYQVGLVVAGETTGLTTIPFKKSGKIKVREVFNVTDMSGIVSFCVTTNYTGSSADETREDFKSNSISELQKNYLDYYSAYFNKIKPDSLTYLDNEDGGEFVTNEFYTIKDFWGESTSLKDASFQPYVIDGVIKKIKDKNRTMPFSLPFPVSFDEDIEIQLPENWTIKKFSENIACPNFILSLNYSCSGRKVLLKYHYENLKDHVLPGEFQEYSRSLAKSNESLGYSLSSTTVGEPGGTRNSNFNYLYVVLGLCVFVTYLVKKQRH